MTRKIAVAISVGLLSFASARMAFAHAILVRSTPADHAIVHSRTVDLTLDYNSRIDASRCILTLTDGAGRTFPVRMLPSKKPAELNAIASNLPNGTYRIHWQVLASDGHITRGEISFTVAGASSSGRQRP